MDAAIEIVDSGRSDGFAFLLKVPSSGRWFRVAPIRDPHQPRFWCVMVCRCLPSGLGDPSERPWFGAGGMERADLPAAMTAIRADVGGWLAGEPCRELRNWLLAPAPEPTNLNEARPAARAGRSNARARDGHPSAPTEAEGRRLDASLGELPSLAPGPEATMGEQRDAAPDLANAGTA